MALDQEIREAADKVQLAESFWKQNKSLIISVGAVCFALGFLLGLIL